MAKFEVKLPDELFEKLADLENKTDKIIEKMLQAGAKPALAAAKSNLRSVIGRNLKNLSRPTCELLSSLGISQIQVDRNGIS
jgi:hypothetical protein